MKFLGYVLLSGLVAAALWGLAFGARMAYQRESVVDHPVRGDAYSYYQRARAIEGAEGAGELKRARFIALAPAYPVFLSWFMDGPDDDPQKVVQRVTRAQAMLGATTSLLVLATGLLFLPLGWALAAGLLTALNPHLIAMDGFLLAESLFTFTTMLGVFLFSCAWRWRSWVLALAGAAVIGLSATMRSLNMLLVVALLGVWLMRAYREASPKGRAAGRRLFVIAITLIVMLAGFGVYRLQANGGVGRNLMAGATWTSIVQGFYPGHFRPGGEDWQDSAWRHDPAYRAMIKNPAEGWARLKQRIADEPMKYGFWYLGGKAMFTWRWDNIYNGDVYIYPMKRKGFEEHAGLTFIHWAMGLLHWPLFAAAWLLPFFLCCRYFRQMLTDAGSCGPALLTFLYAMAVLTVLSPLPRYSIPYRPVAALCAAATLTVVDRWLRRKG